MKAVNLIASGRFTLAVLLAAAGAFVHATFGKGNPYDAWAAFLLSNPAGLVIYCAAVANMAAGIYVSAWNTVRIALAGPQDVRRMDAWDEIDNPPDDWRQHAKQWIVSRGFSICAESDSALVGIKGRWSSLPAIALRAGIVVLLCGIAASHHTRAGENVTLSPGESAEPMGQRLTLVSIDSGIPPSHLQIGKERSFIIEPAVKIETGGSESVVGAGEPVPAGGFYLKVVGIGFTQDIAFDAGTGMRPHRLEVLPPGRDDIVEIAGKTVAVALAPERVIRKGLLSGEVFNLSAPAFRFTQKGSEPVEASAARPSPSGFPSPGKTGMWVRVQAVRDAGLPVFKAGLWITFAALALMFFNLFRYRKEVAFVEDGDRVLVGYSEQYLKKWGIYRFERWKAEMIGSARRQ